MNGSLGWLYHVCPENVVGNRLIPLNRQKTIYPSLFEKNVQTYAGREQVTQRIIPILNCYWNDVIHLTNIPPNDFFRALKEAGRDPNPSTRWLKIPAEIACDHPTVVYACRTTTSDRLLIPENEVTTFDPKKFRTGKLDPRTVQYYREQISLRRKVLVFQGVAHFLLLGEVEFSQCQIITWSDT